MAARLVLEGLHERPTLFVETSFSISNDSSFSFAEGRWKYRSGVDLIDLHDGIELTIDGAKVFARLPDETHHFIATGFYADQNYYPGYYDQNDIFQLGAVWVEEGELKVERGYYATDGEWIRSEDDIPTEVEILEAPQEHVVELAKKTEHGDQAEINIFWNGTLFEQRTLKKNQIFTVGAPGSDLYVDTVPFTELVKNVDGDISVDFLVIDRPRLIAHDGSHIENPQWHGEVTPEFGVIFELGTFTFVVRCTDRPVVAGGAAPFDKQPAPYVGFSGAAHILFLLLALSMPDNARGLDLDSHFSDDRFVQISLTPDQEEEEKLPDYKDEEQAGAEKHAGAEGKAGKPDEKPSDGRMTIKGDPDDPFEIKRRDQQIAMNAGIAQLTSLYADNAQTNGADAQMFIGSIDGHDPGHNQGPFGMGIKGKMPGGGGDLPAGIGINDVGTKGLSKLKGDCKTCVKANVGTKKEVAAVAFPLPKAVMGGTLDREIIRRVIRQNQRAIKFCYEQELQKNRNLSGEITVKFQISAGGDVAFASVVPGGSLKNNKVASCVANRVRRIVFPAPKDGIAVLVKYPFRFFKG